MSDKIEYSKYKKRRITSFFSYEMLYDYLNENLDSERIQLIKEKIHNEKELQEEIKKYELENEFLKSLQKVKATEKLMLQVDSEKSYIDDIKELINFQQWNHFVVSGLEIIIILSVVVGLLVVLPWDSYIHNYLKSPNSIYLSGVQFIKNQVATSDQPEEAVVYSDEDNINKAESSNNVDSSKKVDSTNKADSSKKVENNINAELKDKEVAATKDNLNSTQSKVDFKNSKKTEKQIYESELEKAVAQKIEKIENGGYLFRGEFEISNLKSTRLKFNEEIERLGGRKAGEVELGWYKKKNQAYYHFTIPEAKYNELNAFLSKYSKSQLKQERHPRIMPEGIIRILFVVNEKE